MPAEENKTPATPFQTRDGSGLDCAAVEIVAERVLLRPIAETYAADIFHTFTAQVTRYMEPQPPQQIADTLAFIHRSQRGMRRGENLQFVILKRGSEEFLGCCGLHGYEKPRTPELGIWLKTAAHGHGFGREAITALTRWIEQNLSYDYLTYPVDRANTPSRKIPESLGGAVMEEMRSTTPDGRVLDIVVYHIAPAHQPVRRKP